MIIQHFKRKLIYIFKLTSELEILMKIVKITIFTILFFDLCE